MNSKAIEVCGGIASGKTSLARAVASLGFCSGLENFMLNPFFGAFYDDPTVHAFETEITFLLQHYHTRKIHAVGQALTIFDFSSALDLAYAKVTLKNDDLKIFRVVHQSVLSKLVAPSLIVRLRCSPEVEKERILRRGRPQEKKIEISYLRRLDEAIDTVLNERIFRDVEGQCLKDHGPSSSNREARLSRPPG